MEALAKLCQDPDADVLDVFATGVPLGFNELLPRTPAVFEEKVHWALEDLSGDLSVVWADNHPSARAKPEVLRAQFEEDVSEGLMLEMTLPEARRRFGDRLVIAACGAVAKPGTG